MGNKQDNRKLVDTKNIAVARRRCRLHRTLPVACKVRQLYSAERLKWLVYRVACYLCTFFVAQPILSGTSCPQGTTHRRSHQIIIVNNAPDASDSTSSQHNAKGWICQEHCYNNIAESLSIWLPVRNFNVNGRAGECPQELHQIIFLLRCKD